MVCIGYSELIYRYRNETPCARLIHSCRWSWPRPFLGLPAPCSVRYYEPLTLILLQGAQLIEKVDECTLPPTVQIHSHTAARVQVWRVDAASLMCALPAPKLIPDTGLAVSLLEDATDLQTLWQHIYRQRRKLWKL